MIAFSNINPGKPVGSKPDAPQPPNLVGLSRENLAAQLLELGVPERALKMRTGQVWHWIYHRGVQSFEHMTNVSKDLRALLSAAARIGRPKVVREQISQDGTRKWLLQFDDDEEAETVFIPEDDRGTLCVSSQVGCTLNCQFCHTGTQNWCAT